MQVDILDNSISTLGEGPLYNDKQNAIFWCDIKNNCIYSHNLITKQKNRYSFISQVGSFAFCEDDKQMIVGTKDGIVYYDFLTQKTTPLIHPESHLPSNRLNDGKCDAKGRFFVGSMDDAEKDTVGSLYVYDGKECKQLEQNLAISNGLGWSSDNKKFYLTDSPNRIIYSYDYDLETATLSNRQEFAKIRAQDGYPDGLCVDSEDHIWSAHWNGWKITRYTPNGEIDSIYELPVPKVTSCNFGGADNKTLFVTTANIDLDKETLEKAPLSGSVFYLSLDIKGQMSNRFVVS